MAWLGHGSVGAVASAGAFTFRHSYRPVLARAHTCGLTLQRYSSRGGATVEPTRRSVSRRISAGVPPFWSTCGTSGTSPWRPSSAMTSPYVAEATPPSNRIVTFSGGPWDAPAAWVTGPIPDGNRTRTAHVSATWTGRRRTSHAAGDRRGALRAAARRRGKVLACRSFITPVLGLSALATASNLGFSTTAVKEGGPSDRASGLCGESCRTWSVTRRPRPSSGRSASEVARPVNRARGTVDGARRSTALARDVVGADRQRSVRRVIAVVWRPSGSRDSREARQVVRHLVIAGRPEVSTAAAASRDVEGNGLAARGRRRIECHRHAAPLDQVRRVGDGQAPHPLAIGQEPGDLLGHEVRVPKGLG